jgi:hypothetical protein
VDWAGRDLGAGAGGIASMPLTGLTAFGFKGGNQTGGLNGTIYDLKQTPSHQPTEMADHKAGGNGKDTPILNHEKFFAQFFKSGWDESLLDRFYRSPQKVVAYQIFIPYILSTEGPKSFGVEKEIPLAKHWMVLYKGTVVAPKDGTFRFHGFADDCLAVRFNGQNVFIAAWFDDNKILTSIFKDPSSHYPRELHDTIEGKWFSVTAGQAYPIEVLVSEVPGGLFSGTLTIEEKYPEKPYPYRTQPGKEKELAYPIFQLKKGMPIPERKSFNGGHGGFDYIELAPDPVIFKGK